METLDGLTYQTLFLSPPLPSLPPEPFLETVDEEWLRVTITVPLEVEKEIEVETSKGTKKGTGTSG